MNEKKALQELGKNLRDIREKKGISQEKLAELSDMHRTYISGIERGNRNISFISILKIARALEVNVNELFKGIN